MDNATSNDRNRELLRKARQALDAYSALERQARLQELQEQIRSGVYKIPVEALAARLIRLTQPPTPFAARLPGA
jgi:anti-sigma28 factor (negative regulator of flagellin synthesis)